MFSELLDKIELGRSGDVPWIPLKYPRLGSAIGISHRMYHLVGGDPGSGKTAFVDQTYVLDPYDWFMQQEDISFEVVYFSMERSKVYKKAKWLAHKLYRDHGILIDVPSLLGWGTARTQIDDELMDIIKSKEEYFDNMWKNVEIIDGSDNPTGVYKALKQRALNKGKLYHRRNPEGNYIVEWMEQGVEKSRQIEASNCPVDIPHWDQKYVPDNDKLITLVVLDHVGKMQTERGFSEKQILDKTSEYLGVARDRYGYCCVAISQFNRNNANIQRRINTDLSPEQQDFKGTGNTFEDADVVLALFDPARHKLSKFRGYNIPATVNSNGVSRFRSISLLKNSYGMDNAVFGYQFVGENGYFNELLQPTQMQMQNYEDLKNV